MGSELSILDEHHAGRDSNLAPTMRCFGTPHGGSTFSYKKHALVCHLCGFQKGKVGGRDYVQLSACPCLNSPQCDGVAGVLKGHKWLGLTSSARFEGMLLSAMREIFNVDTGKFEAFSSCDRDCGLRRVFVGSRTLAASCLSTPLSVSDLIIDLWQRALHATNLFPSNLTTSTMYMLVRDN